MKASASTMELMGSKEFCSRSDFPSRSGQAIPRSEMSRSNPSHMPFYKPSNRRRHLLACASSSPNCFTASSHSSAVPTVILRHPAHPFSFPLYLTTTPLLSAMVL